MKKVKLTKRVRVGGKSCKTGTIIEVGGETFDSLIEKGLGEEYFGNEGGIKVGGGGGAGGKSGKGGKGAGEGAGTGGGGGADDNGGGAGDGDIGGLDGMTRIELMDYLKGAGIEFDTRDDKATLLGLAKKG